ncbi:ATP synthase F1 subunit gamma [Patescibacteria group bacterium]|nr:ATP synthase F1 subunit gamma [Patescibacteria group bacterium]MBU1448550.1 ATP synthase F1 subunit gamma [Patescibacteria group bacterium]MBU2613045.1 ATP synthase F1 subunit gamma [Patescibacteria group bacterium]
MPVSSRLIRRRIRSIANTRKITKAMELVAAAKMRRSVALTTSSRAYSSTAKRIVDDVRRLVDPATHPLLAGRPNPVASLIIVTAADRGLCGGFNSQIVKKTLEFLATRTETDLRVVTVGKRAEAAIKRAGYPILAAFEAISNAPTFDRSRPVGELAYRAFMDGEVDRVFVMYTDFRSAIAQVPTVAQLLPIIPEDELTSAVDADGGVDGEAGAIFEPNPRAVLDRLLPRLLETRIYQALLESAASEHSSRMMTMRNATDNATGILDDLTFTYNQARQAGITREISEISAGKAALE